MNDEYPRIAFLHNWGWEVIESSPGKFRLITADDKFIGTFGTCEAAINYMNNEFL